MFSSIHTVLICTYRLIKICPWFLSFWYLFPTKFQHWNIWKRKLTLPSNSLTLISIDIIFYLWWYITVMLASASSKIKWCSSLWSSHLQFSAILIAHPLYSEFRDLSDCPPLRSTLMSVPYTVFEKIRNEALLGKHSLLEHSALLQIWSFVENHF